MKFIVFKANAKTASDADEKKITNQKGAYLYE